MSFMKQAVRKLLEYDKKNFLYTIYLGDLFVCDGAINPFDFVGRE